MALVPEQIALNLDVATGRIISQQLGEWVYGAQVVPVVENDVPATGATITPDDNSSLVIINPAAVIAALTIKLPANPVDGQKVTIIFGGTVAVGASVVTALTVDANTDQHLYAADPASPAIGGTTYTYQYRASNATWYVVSADEISAS